MAQRNTYREDEELEEQINFRDILRVGKYLLSLIHISEPTRH